MSVYVDDLRPVGSYSSSYFGYRILSSCHLMADSGEELEWIRKELGLRPGWRHGDHYDLTPSKRSAALSAGAVEVSSLDLVKLRQSKKGSLSDAEV